jgi:hypothetical protein
MATLTPQPLYLSGLEARVPPCLCLEGPRCLPDLASLIGSTDAGGFPTVDGEDVFQDKETKPRSSLAKLGTCNFSISDSGVGTPTS